MSERAEDRSNRMIEDIGTAMRFKAVLLKKGIFSGQTRCPRCEQPEALQMRISQHRNRHCRMWCATEGCTMSKMME